MTGGSVEFAGQDVATRGTYVLILTRTDRFDYLESHGILICREELLPANTCRSQ
jgi:hypothetical protein